MGPASMLVSADWCQYLFNMGVAIFRRSAWMMDFLGRTVDMSREGRWRNDGAWEQSAMVELWVQNDRDRAHIRILTDTVRLQAQLKWAEYQRGSWTVHNTWCPRPPVLDNHRRPCIRSARWNLQDCERVMLGYYCLAAPEDCPCRRARNQSNPRRVSWPPSVWRDLEDFEMTPTWLESAWRDVCRHDLLWELQNPSNHTQHPLCEPGCIRCLPEQKREHWPHREGRILGPSWHRNRTLRWMEEGLQDEEELLLLGAGRRSQAWKAGAPGARRHRRYWSSHSDADYLYYVMPVYVVLLLLLGMMSHLYCRPFRRAAKRQGK